MIENQEVRIIGEKRKLINNNLIKYISIENKLIPFTIFIDLLIILSSIVLTCLNFSMIFISKNLTSDLIDEIGNNWKNFPIKNIYKSTVPCTNSIIHDKWKRIKDGFICINTNSTKYFPNSYYTNEENCRILINSTQLLFNSWRGNYVCADFMNINYFNITLMENNTECLDNKLYNCGIIDSQGNNLCLENEDECPINYITINDNSIKNMKILDLGDKKIIYSNKYYNNNIITNFKISDNQPCINPISNFQDLQTLDVNYLFDTDNCKLTNNKYYDYSYSQIDTYSKMQLYKDNNIYDFINNITKFSNESNIYSNLYSRNYIGITQICKRKLNKFNDIYLKFENYSSIILNIKNFGYEWKSFTFLICSICSGVTTIYFYIFTKTKDKAKELIIRIFTDLGLVLICIYEFILIIKYINIISKYREFLKILAEPICFSEDYFYMLKDESILFNSVYLHLFSIMIISGINLFLYIFHILMIVNIRLIILISKMRNK